MLTAEESGAAVPAMGWRAQPITVWEGEQLVGGAPAWIKGHSMGEFVYDQGWADAARRAGIPYYPKVIVAPPFSPVTGQRVLARDAGARSAVLAGLDAIGQHAGGIHILFDGETEAEALRADGYFSRCQYQFHWKNAGYRSFDDFLAGFRSDARNKIRRERKSVSGLDFTVEIGPSGETLAALHRFYQHTAAQFGPWGHVYLSEPAFRQLGQRWGHRLHAVVAREGDRIVGGALNVLKGDRLYGRYWGCDDQIPFLHFEVCYYRAIDWCIAHGIAVFEPGHGGEHKYRRGFSPTVTWSSHRLRDPRLHDALERWSAKEAEAIAAQVDALRQVGPFR